MDSSLNIESLIINNLTSEGFIIKDLKEEDTVYLNEKLIIDELVQEFNDLNDDGERKKYTCSNLQRHINFVTRSDFPIGVIIFSLYIIGIPFTVSKGRELSFLITPEAFDKKFLRLIRAELICDCKPELDNSYYGIKPNPEKLDSDEEGIE